MRREQQERRERRSGLAFSLMKTKAVIGVVTIRLC
jgi:hypothetical protein